MIVIESWAEDFDYRGSSELSRVSRVVSARPALRFFGRVWWRGRQQVIEEQIAGFTSDPRFYPEKARLLVPDKIGG